MSTKLDERRRSSGTKEKLLNAFRRVSLVRRPSQERDLPLAGPSGSASRSSDDKAGAASSSAPVRRPSHIRQKPSLDSIASVASVASPSSRGSSVRPPQQKLNSSSPASELPQTWEEWNYAYQHGFIDFDDPPPPPSDLRSSEFATMTGQFRAPFPANETRRQRAVDSIGLFNRPSPSSANKRRASLKGPRDASGAPAQKPAPPPPSYPDASADSAPTYEAEEHGAEEEDEDEGGLTAQVTKRQEGPMHPALERLAQEARRRFGVDATTVSLMDRDEQVFLADDACSFLEDRDSVPRELTCCSHAMLKASSTGTKDPLVILDFAKDWRFQKNGFGSYEKGFYAAAPIMLPAPMGDDQGSYPGGIFCLLGEKPKQAFSQQDRLDLQEMADRASLEIQQHAAHTRRDKRVELAQKRQEWKKSKLVHRASSRVNALDTVVEMPTPPRTPDLGPIDLGDAAEEELFAQAEEELGAPRRPSLVESIGSDGAMSDLHTTSVTPTFSSRRAERPGVLAAPPKPLAPEVQSVLDLSTQLVAESIEMDFAYVVAVDVAAARRGAAYAGESDASRSPIRLVSTYGMPIPPPLFSVESHLETLVSTHSALLFTEEDFSGAVGEFSTGLLVKIATRDDVGYLLGCFSEDGRRVLNQEDLLFLRSFGRDLRKYTDQLS
ncbi:hypothetical protein JCM10450v2_000774 [Rhodotorula kratochvilovae]